jgi:hypothetical protein
MHPAAPIPGPWVQDGLMSESMPVPRPGVKPSRQLHLEPLGFRGAEEIPGTPGAERKDRHVVFPLADTCAGNRQGVMLFRVPKSRPDYASKDWGLIKAWLGRGGQV